MPINEVARLKVKDLYYPSGKLKHSFSIPKEYTKTGKSRVVYIFATRQREALEALRQTWRNLSFNPKRYKDRCGNELKTMVCGSLENLVRELLKGAGLHGGSSHSGRRGLATLLDRKGHPLKLIQQILGHESPEMSLLYIEAWEKRIDIAFKSSCQGLRLPTW